jgi:hypothetical protein
MVFQIEWVPTAAILALAKKRGMPSENDSPLDYCEADDAANHAQAGSFAEALELAKGKLAEDYFGQVRIEHLVKIQSRYMRDRWDADAVWHLSDGDELAEDEPEYRPEIDLIDDEEIVA